MINNWKKFNEKIYKKEPLNFLYSDKIVFNSKLKTENIIKKFNPNFPNKIKVEELFFKYHPDLFADIINIDYNRGIMIQKKLDSQKALNDLTILYDYFIKYNYINPISNYKLDRVLIFLINLIPNSYLYQDKNAKIKLKDIKINDLNVKNIFNIWIEFLIKLGKIQPYVYNKPYFDTHMKNFGYDNQNNLKLFDI